MSGGTDSRLETKPGSWRDTSAENLRILVNVQDNGTTAARGVALWTPIHAAGLLISTIISLFVSGLTVLPAIAGAASLITIWILQRTFRLPDAVSALRGLAAFLFFVLTAAEAAGTGVLLALVIAAEVLDFFDGFFARRSGGSEFGGAWDMEIDAYFILLLSISAFVYHGAFPLVILAGLYRYAFVFVFKFVEPVEVANRVLGFFMKTACVAAVIALIFANQDWLTRGWQLAGEWTAFSVLTVSFFWEAGYYLRARRRNT